MFSPEVGLVIRYDYLWRSEHDLGRIEGLKHRPCVIFGIKSDHVYIFGVTHRQPSSDILSLEVPISVSRSLFSDDFRSWIILSESNALRWVEGEIIPGMVRVPSGDWTYGKIPESLGHRIGEMALSLASSSGMTYIVRD